MNYRNISLTFWTDSKVDDDFTPEDKYFYLYILTNPHTNICGCYEISTKQMERETGYNVDTVLRLIQRMEVTHNVIRYSKDTKEVLVLNWSKYNWSSSEKLRQAVRSVAMHIKEPSFKAYIFNKLDGNENSENPENKQNTDNRTQNTEYRIQNTETVSDTDVSIGYGYPIDTVSEKPKSKSSRFVPPTLEEVQSYCCERKNTVDAERFVDYYEANGWKVGKNSMKDWKAAVRSWEKNGYSNKSTVNTAGVGKDEKDYKKEDGSFDLEQMFKDSGLM